ncbi:hypothetical protein NRB16_12690 [Pseudomonas sp. LJDD11]|uniref:hypothetical protein n=1 Tax=Pseudomonas sp. LJDD11 TaxID=2931984 RepID=UPI00211B8EEB|nr:hypothetical protein [Pseudomonas sp. LJDD11]MCQ9424372.1 hypothetical protein [Pseudomonas sp. LJDD11]
MKAIAHLILPAILLASPYAALSVGTAYAENGPDMSAAPQPNAESNTAPPTESLEPREESASQSQAGDEYAGDEQATTSDISVTQGTVERPNTWSDYSRVGDINVYEYGGQRLLFQAKREGRPSDYNWHYPTSASDNEHWTFYSRHIGTFSDPKDWNDYSVPGDIHRYEYGYKTLFFQARQSGRPSAHNWYYPTREVSDANWTYKGLHAGTWQDPKTWNEPTWPGAVHWYKEYNLFFTSRVTGTPSANYWHYPTSAVSNTYWSYLNPQTRTAPTINDLDRGYDKYTWVTAHNAYLDALTPQLDRGVRGFMLDLRLDSQNTVRMCHKPGPQDKCSTSDPSLRDAFSNTFLPYLQQNPNAVIALLLEAYVSQDDIQRVFEQVPDLANYSYAHGDNELQWPTLRQLISTNKRLLIYSDRSLPGTYQVGNKNITIYRASDHQIENTYNLGDTVLIHNWECKSRYGAGFDPFTTSSGMNKLFVLNQFHSFGSSTAHAGDMDNNLTWLQRRVERYCSGPTNGRNPNFLTIDFNQVGDAFPYAAALSQGGYYFYEHNAGNRDGDSTCALPGNQPSGSDGVQYNLRLAANGCENDEIRSLELDGIRAGTRLELYDSPDADRQDDFTLIDVKQSIPMGQRVRINSLEGSAETFYYRKLAAHNNGLDGKVSRIRVRTTPADNDISDALIVFHEGNNGSQNIVCSVPFDTYRAFKMGSGNNPYGCDNDEIRSAKIIKAGKGSTFRVMGNPNGSPDQGQASVTVKRNILTPVTIGSFASSYENADVKVIGGGGNLDGKISYGDFQPKAEPEQQPEPEPQPDPPPDPGAPAAPTDLRLEQQQQQQHLRLRWNPSSNAVKYRVFHYFKQIGEVTGTSLAYDHPDSVAGRYHVHAVDSQDRLSPRSDFLWVYPEW